VPSTMSASEVSSACHTCHQHATSVISMPHLPSACHICHQRATSVISMPHLPSARHICHQRATSVGIACTWSGRSSIATSLGIGLLFLTGVTATGHLGVIGWLKAREERKNDSSGYKTQGHADNEAVSHACMGRDVQSCRRT